MSEGRTPAGSPGSRPEPPRAGPRRALVLGSGGVLGFAWMLGALTEIEAAEGFDARDVDLVIGTSAGSVVAALLGCRMSVGAIARHHQGVPAEDDPAIEYDYSSATGEALPPRPGIRPGAPRLALGGLRVKRRVPPVIALAGLAPPGRGSLQAVHELVAGVAAGAGFAQSWPTAPRPWVVATDYRRGGRVVFGRPGSAEVPAAGVGASVASPTGPEPGSTVSLADAVTASCSIPGWYPPTVIDGVPYIDGGASSNVSLDLIDPATVDEVYALVPMATLDPDRPSGAMARAERWLRRVITRRVVAEAGRLRSAGVRVTLLAPGSEVLTAMGVNMMDPGRRAEVFDVARVGAAIHLQARADDGLGWVARSGGGRR
jgi:NTE family protein